jgi:ADP-ribosylglycohydrolase
VDDITTETVKLEDITAKLSGCLLGMAVGDALGLPREDISRLRAVKFFGTPPLSHRFILKHGMVSDDTEHAIMTAESLLMAKDDPHRFAVVLAWKLRLWLLGLPAGTGLATARAIIKLWLGWPPARSGVASAGNGPAMRSPIIGAALAFQQLSLKEFVYISTRMTHTDPRAEEGAFLIAQAAREGALHGPVYDAAPVLATWRQQVENQQLLAALDQIEHHLSLQSSAQVFADDMGLQKGVSGFINHTVPVVLYAWLRYPDDYWQAVEAVIALGGDADTTGAIVGGLMGATLGDAAIPREWIDGIAEWPKTTQWMRRLCERLASSITTGETSRIPAYFWPAALFRNLVFLLIVLYHGFRRLFPPY